MLSSSLSNSPSLFPFTTTSTSSLPFLSTLSATSVASPSSSFDSLTHNPNSSSTKAATTTTTTTTTTKSSLTFSEHYETALRHRIFQDLTHPQLLYLPFSLPSSFASLASSELCLGSRSLPLPSKNSLTLSKIKPLRPFPFSMVLMTPSFSVQWKRKQALQKYRHSEKMKGLV